MRKFYWSCMLTAVLAAMALPMSAARRSQTVLVIYANDSSLPANVQVNEKLRQTLGVDSNLNLTYQTEFLDYPRYADEDNVAYDRLLSNFLRSKYAGESIDAIVAGGRQAFGFLRRHQNDLFVGVPVVVIDIGRTSFQDQPTQSRFLDIPVILERKPTFEMAMRLQPKASEIVIVTGTSISDRVWERNLSRIVTELPSHPPVRYISGLPLDDVLHELSRLPSDAIVCSEGFQQDGSGHTYAARDVVQRMAEASSAPLYSFYSTTINFGIVGGYLFNMADLGTQAGEIVQRILNGEKLTQKDMPTALPSHYVVDWNQLQRWHLREANLPPGTMIVNRQPSPWQKYRGYILSALLLLILEALLILYLLAERRRRRLVQVQLAERLRSEILVAQVSSEFTNLESGKINQAILHSLRSVQEFSQSSVASIWQTQHDGNRFLCTHIWPENTGESKLIIPADLPDTSARLLRGETVLFSGERESSKLDDHESFRRSQIQSFLAVPIQSENRILGALSLIKIGEAASWSPDILPLLNTIADILGGGLGRQRVSEALRESEALKNVILNYMQSNVLVVDSDGVILEVNRHWADSATRDAAAASQFNVGVGVNYLDAYRKDIDSDEALHALTGIRSVLSGLRHAFETEYIYPSPSEPRWFRMTVMQLPRASGGALIIHFDITQQKLAELERKKMQEETAQLHRVTEMGQLVASLAHELAQPLAAVLSNAQAASRLASRSEPDLAEIQAALLDIIEDDQRARAVLNNVRALLKKHAVTPHGVNLNQVVENVALMVKSSAQLRGVQLKTMLADGDVLVQGDEIPLQQVLLNLINNAMDAMSQIPLEQRVLTLKTAVHPTSRSGLLIVEDKGPGVPDSLKASLFQPFFTTKAEGLGMGLAICQTILQTLGGSIDLQSRPGEGATFRVVLPPAHELAELIQDDTVKVQ